MKYALQASCAALILLLLTSAGAQTSRPIAGTITVDVPFDFMIEQMMFPAGEYRVTPAGDQSFYLRARQGLESATFTIRPITTPTYSPRASLIFAEENGHLQLHQLWMNSKIGGEVSRPQIQQWRNVRASRVEVRATCTNCQ